MAQASFLYPVGSRCQITQQGGNTSGGIITSTSYDPTTQEPTITFKSESGATFQLKKGDVTGSKFFRFLPTQTDTPQVSSFDSLTNAELYAILKLRCDVFVVEQTCPYPELDNVDQQAIHVFLPTYALANPVVKVGSEEYDPYKTVSYLRIYDQPGEPGVVKIGRVVTAERKSGLGAQIFSRGLEVSRDICHAHEVYIEAQVHARGFYEKFGFVPCGPEFIEDDISHVPMRLKL